MRLRDFIPHVNFKPNPISYWKTHQKLPDVLKREALGHLPRHTRRESPDLCVDLGQVGERRPLPDMHNCTVGGSTQLHSHGTSCAQAVMILNPVCILLPTGNHTLHPSALQVSRPCLI